MIESSFFPSESDLIKLITGILVVTASFAGFYHQFNVENMIYLFIAAFIIVTIRELGLRTVSQWMQGYVETKLSKSGSV
ncbi:MAG: hypothetical protein ABEI78_00160, partial [Candidatus Nanohaloarchaea archaeon]